MTTISADVLAKLKTFDTPTICNVIEHFDVRPRNVGFMDKSIKAAYPEMPPVVGFAATFTLRTAFDPQLEGGAYSGTEDQVESFAQLSGPPVVVFQDLDSPPLGATFGEMMCSTYQGFGAVGLITNGPGRDMEQVRDLGFPVFTDGVVCSHSYVRMFDILVPVHVGGMAIFPDDLIHADLNGVATIPKDIAAEVADAGDELVAAEKVVLDAVKQPGVTVAQLRAARAEYSNLAAKLHARVSRKK